MPSSLSRLARRHLGVVLPVLVLSAAGVAVAAGAQDAIDARHAHFKAMGADFKAINEMLKSGTATSAVLLPRIHDVQAAARQLPSWFPAGSGPDSGLKTHAKAEVWSDAAEFRDADALLVARLDKLEQIASHGDMAAAAEQAHVAGQACGACHAKFRVKD